VLNDDGDFVGFDVVIGNPPYLNVELMEKREKEYYKLNFSTFYKRSDIFNLFIDFASLSLTLNGTVAFIVPSIVLNNLSYKPLREKLLKNNWLSRVFYTGGNIFEEATVDTVILFIDKKPVKSIELTDALNFGQPRTTVVDNNFFEKFDYTISVSGDENSNKVFDKIEFIF
jgi:type I restriction-modification system DNA methylase subunit